MARNRRVDVRISLAGLGAVRWPPRPLVGEGAPALVLVPMPALPWARVSMVEMPLGEGMARRIVTVARLRKIYGYVIFPLIILLLLFAVAALILGWFGVMENGRTIFGVLGFCGLVMSWLGYIPGIVAIVTNTPRVVGSQLRLRAVHADVAREAVSINAPGLIQVTDARVGIGRPWG